MMQQLVSVIIPTYNRGYTLKRAIDSVLNQTYSHIELIVVDDNSDDETEMILHEYNKGKYVIKYIKNTDNLGATASRNIGAKHANGAFLAFLDSDDYWYKDKLKKQLAELTIDVGIGLVFTGVEEYDEIEKKSKKEYAIKKHFSYADLLIGDPIGSNSGPLIKKDIFFQVGAYDEKLPARQDWDLWIRVAKVSKVVAINYIGYKYFHGRSDQISKGINKKLSGTLTVYQKYYKDFFADKTAYSNITRTIAYMYIRQGDKAKALAFLKMSNQVSPSFNNLLFINFIRLFGVKASFKFHRHVFLLKYGKLSYLDR